MTQAALTSIASSHSAPRAAWKGLDTSTGYLRSFVVLNRDKLPSFFHLEKLQFLVLT